MKLALKINGQWAVLPADASISFVSTSPLFSSEKGDISYPFELDIHENSHIFHNLADTHGYVRLAEYHRLPAEVWYDGMQLFVGQTEVDDTVEFDGDTISINIISAGKSFADAIDGMNCRDVPLKDDIVIGSVPCVDENHPLELAIEGYLSFFVSIAEVENAQVQFNSITNDRGEKILNAYIAIDEESGIPTGVLDIELKKNVKESVLFDAPRFLIPFDHNGNATYNEDLPYPASKYCTAKLCQPNGEKAADGAEGSGYSVVLPEEANSAPSFYLLYFLECLFTHLGFSFDLSTLTSVKDMNRLMMLNAFPRYEIKGGPIYKPDIETDAKYNFHVNGYNYKYLVVNRKRTISANYGDKKSINRETKWSTSGLSFAVNALRLAYATSENFPDVDVQKVIESMENAFGVIFDYNQNTNDMRIYLKRDIIQSNEVVNVGCIILNEYVTRMQNGGVKVSYGEDEDTQYNYDTTEKTVQKLGFETFDGYNDIVSADRSLSDTTTKYDQRTGYAYRIKVNEDTGQEPQLFSVGDYHDVAYGKDISGNIEPEEIILPFKPVTLNDIWGWRQTIDGVENPHPKDSSDSEMAVFVSEESFGETANVKSLPDEKGYTHKAKVKCSEAVTSTVSKIYKTPDGKGSFNMSWDGKFSLYGQAARDLSDSKSKHPLENYDAGLQLGIMRGSGTSEGGVVVLQQNYDGEGNDSWGYFPARGGGISADSVDRWGSLHNYNDGEPTSMSGRISLMLDARKTKEYTDDGDPVFYPIAGVPDGVPAEQMARRGLVPQLLEEYLYFMAHKTPITLEVEMSLSEFRAIPYLTRVNIGTHTGFIYSKEYTITEEGLQKAVVTLYEINK